jgi:type IX secretion system substrate protein
MIMKSILLLTSLLFLIFIRAVAQPEIAAGGSADFTEEFQGFFIIDTMSVSSSGDDADLVEITLQNWEQDLSNGNVTADITIHVDLSAPVGSTLSFKIKYFFNSSSGGGLATIPWSILVTEGEPTILFPLLVYPEDNTTEIPVLVIFTWIPSTGATSSFIRVATDINFTNIVVLATVPNSSSGYSDTLNSNTTYYWRVRSLGISGLSDWSETWKFTTESSTSTSEQSVLTNQLQGIKIYPNPSDGLFTLEGNGLVGDWQVSVFNLQGQKLWADNWKTGGNDNMVLQLGFLAKGMYWVQLTDGEERAWEKIVVQ